MKLLSGNTDCVAVTFLALLFSAIPAMESVHAKFQERIFKIQRIESKILRANHAIQMELDRQPLRCIRMVE